MLLLKKEIMMRKIFSTSFIGLVGYTMYKLYIPKENRLNFVFDLDSTLIHCRNDSQYENTNKNLLKNHNLAFTCEQDYKVWKRPFSSTILLILQKFNNVHIFTARQPECANIIIDNLFKNIHFDKKFYEENCESCLGGKNLDIFNMDNSKIILIDDNKSNHINKHNYFYHIYPYSFINKYDFEMIKLLGFAIVANLFGLEKTKLLYKKHVY